MKFPCINPWGIASLNQSFRFKPILGNFISTDDASINNIRKQSSALIICTLYKTKVTDWFRRYDFRMQIRHDVMYVMYTMVSCTS